MSRGKKLLGLLMAVGLSVGMSVTPVLAETTSILDEITAEETTEDFAEDTEYYPARSTNLNCGNVKNPESKQWGACNLRSDTVS